MIDVTGVLSRRGLDQLHILTQQLIDQLIDRGAARLRPRGKEIEYFRLQAQGRNQAQIGPVELPALV